MAIHHTHHKKAEKAGYSLSEDEVGIVRAFWPKRAVEVFGTSSSDAMTQMQAAMALTEGGYKVQPARPNDRLVIVTRRDDGHMLTEPMPPVAAHKAIILDKNAEWVDSTPYNNVMSAAEKESLDEGTDDSDGGVSGGLSSGVSDTAAGDGEAAGDDPAGEAAASGIKPVARSENGVALDGGIAYAEGTPAGDNPFSLEEDEEEYERAQKWDEEWDAAADAADAEDGEKGGSVVNAKYRAIYAERGHPEHCGDWLAEVFNNAVKSKEGTAVARVDAIAVANGVNNTKYDRTRPGWQGRLRMTTRNLLAKVVWMADGVFRVPDAEGNIEELRAPGDWMASQRFKKPKGKEQAAPAAEPTATE